MAIESENGIAKVSEYVNVKVGLPNYSSIEVNFGHTRSCLDTAVDIQRTAARIHKLNKDFIEKRLQEYINLATEIAEAANS